MGLTALDPKTSAQWWLPEFAERRHEVLVRVVDQIYHAQNYRRDQMLRMARMYGARAILGLSPTTYSQRMAVGGQSGGTVSFNVAKSCADSYVSKLTKDKPKVSFVTSDGDKSTQDRARGLERFSDGQLYELGFYDELPRFALDTCWAGCGIAKFQIVGKAKKRRIAMERVQPHELLVDDAEGVYGKPRSLYQIRYIDRAVLTALYPDEAEAILAAPRHDRHLDPDAYETLADYVLVRFAWHLPSGKKDGSKGDGRYTVAIVGATLEDEEWTRDDFPFVVLRRALPLQGWWGSALIEDIAGIQRELNILLYKIQRHYHLIGVAHWFVAKGSVNKGKLDNDLSIIEHLPGQRPEVGSPNTLVSPEIYAHLDRLYQKAYELIGISPMTAQSTIPSQIESGKAMQVLADVQSDRFMTNYRLMETFVMGCVKQIITLAREISGSNPDYAVRAFDNRRMAKIVFGEHWLDEEEYVLKMYPTNLLANDPSARMGQVEKLAGAGWIQPDQAMRLLDYPDIAADAADANATHNATQRIVEKILEQGEFIGPDPTMTLSEAIPIVKAAVVKTIGVEGIDPERVDMLRRWLVQAVQLETPPPAPAAPAPAPPGAPPPPPMEAPAQQQAA